MQETGILQGNTDRNSIVKNYITPFTARYVRLYPWESHRDIADFRMELYAQTTAFEWSALSVDSSHGAPGSTSFCTKTMSDLASAFQIWTPGMNGDGTIYASQAHSLHLSGVEYNVTAYQRRLCLFTGMVVTSLALGFTWRKTLSSKYRA